MARIIDILLTFGSCSNDYWFDRYEFRGVGKTRVWANQRFNR